MASKRKAAHLDADSNKNKEICDMLLELAEYERNVTREHYKYNAYRKAAASIKDHPQAIMSGEEASKLPGVGKKISAKIDEFLSSGKLEKLDMIRVDEGTSAVRDLTRISGVGPANAKKFIKKGMHTIEDLKKHTDQLSHHQKIGLKYVNDFEKRIPRAEMELIENEIKNCMSNLDEDIDMTVCGSYRRGAATSGDIDILITHPKFTHTLKDYEGKDLLKRVVNALEKEKIVTDTLSLGESKFMGVCKLPGGKNRKHRRIDIRLLPSEEYVCGVLYFTGSDEFNRQMRAKALEKGLTLNEYCLRKVHSKGKSNEPLPVKTEKDVFKYIGMSYKQPHQRNL